MSQIINILALIGLSVYFMYLNRWRGSDDRPKIFFSKVVVYFVMALMITAYGALVDHDYMFETLLWNIPNFVLITVAGFLNIWACFAPGWGKYFPTGWNETPSGSIIYLEKEEPIGEFVANKVVGQWNIAESESWVKRWQAWGMAGRFLWFTIILFPVLALVFQNVCFLVTGLFMPLSGLFYYISFINHDENSVPNAEKIVGFWLGFLIGLALLCAALF